MRSRTDTPDFAGTEDPRDGTLSVLFVRDSDGQVTGAIVDFANHPNSVGCGEYYSADNGTPVIRMHHTDEQPWMGEEGLWQSGRYLAGEAARVIASAVSSIESPEFRLEHASPRIPVRPYPKPDDNDYPQRMGEESLICY